MPSLPQFSLDVGKEMKVGVTGTQFGATADQVATVYKLLSTTLAPVEELHHGDCVGADQQCHQLVTSMQSMLDIRTIGHPPVDYSRRAFCKCDELREEKEYLVRNHDIVDEVDWLIVIPRTHHEEMRSGTWATKRYAVKVRKDGCIVWPDGAVTAL